MKKTIAKIVKEAIPMLILMIIMTVFLLSAVYPALGKWVLISVGSIIGAAILFFILSNIASSRNKPKEAKPKPLTPAMKKEQRVQRWEILQGVLIFTGCVVGILSLPLLPICVLLLILQPTYDGLLVIGAVIGAISLICFLIYLAKNGGDLTNVFSGEWWLP